MRNLHLVLAIFGFIASLPFSASARQLSSRDPHFSSLTPWEQIHQTLHTYPLAVDSKNGALFSDIFAPDAVANYTGALSDLTGIDAIREGLLLSVASLITQHHLGTTLIDVHEDEKSANATTYVIATLFSVAPATAGRYTMLLALYADELVKLDVGWRISHRLLVFMTPSLGNLTLG